MDSISNQLIEENVRQQREIDKLKELITELIIRVDKVEEKGKSSKSFIEKKLEIVFERYKNSLLLKVTGETREYKELLKEHGYRWGIINGEKSWIKVGVLKEKEIEEESKSIEEILEREGYEVNSKIKR